MLSHVDMITAGVPYKVETDMYLVIKDGYIQDIGHHPLPEHIEKEWTVYNQKGKIVLSGMYNTHAHTPMSLLRGVSDDVELQTWLKQEIWPREGLLDREKVKTSSSLALAEMIKSGTVAFLDMYHLHMDDVFELTMQAGMKAVLSRGMIGFGTKEEQAQKVEEATALAAAWNKNGNGQIRGMLFPHAPYTCPPPFLEMVIAKAHENNLPLGIHLAETSEEVERHKQLYGKPPVVHLDELGFFEGEAVLTHMVHLTEEEIELVHQPNLTISHNPMSNAKLGSGIAPVPAMLKKGLHVTLGTDSTASNNNLDMFEEMRTAALLQKAAGHQSGAVTAEQVVDMATVRGAKALGFLEEGLLQPGAPADFILLDASSLHLQPVHNIFSHLVYSASGADVTDVFVNGRQLMKNRQLQTLDEERIRYDINQSFDDLERMFVKQKEGRS
ncbi:amidohydrolase [Alteribacillus persepolensis]|uniref:amidohydrolase n=1 Tax=Alteribacillus persepolensis TaxID=568899 RepID=UPI001FDFF162|nr:amidohydrolase [Alteribacillus persepolensis]